MNKYTVIVVVVGYIVLGLGAHMLAKKHTAESYYKNQIRMENVK